MNFKNFINEKLIVVDTLNSKFGFFNKIADIAFENKIIFDKKILIECLIERENKGSTGLLDGFAIPHAQSETIEKASVVIVKSYNKVKWESLDEGDVETAISLLVPKSQAGTTHIDFLSEVSTLIMDENFRLELSKLYDINSIYNLIVSKL